MEIEEVEFESTVFIGIGTMLMVLMAPWIYKIWLGGLIEISEKLTLAIGIYTVVLVLVNPLSRFLNGTGKINILVWLAPLEIGFFLIGCFVFDYLIGSVEAIVWGLGFASCLGLFMEPIVLRKLLWHGS